MKNNLLRISIFLARFILALDIILAALLVVLMILWPMNTGLFDNFRMAQDGIIFKFETTPLAEGMPLSQYGNFYFYFLCLKALLTTGIVYMIAKTAIRIIHSISSVETFRLENVQSFRHMGKLFLTWLAISLFSIKEAVEGVSISAEVEMKYAIWALICFILAEIFSEGNKLMEDNKLTI